MGEYESGKTIGWLTAYFIALIFILSLLQAGFSAMNLEYSFTVSNDETFIPVSNNGQTCSAPRQYLDTDGETYELTGNLAGRTDCKFTAGSVDPDTCNGIDGCMWQDASTIFFIFTRDAYCSGDVNMTNYTYFENIEYDFFKSPTSTHDPNTLYITAGDTIQYYDGDSLASRDMCGAINDRTSCQLLSCQWVDVSDLAVDTSSVGIGTVLDITGALFTFNATFTDNYWTNLLITLILFYLPLIWYVIAIYFALPFLH